MLGVVVTIMNLSTWDSASFLVNVKEAVWVNYFEYQTFFGILQKITKLDAGRNEDLGNEVKQSRWSYRMS
jgi:hypothetical protein